MHGDLAHTLQTIHTDLHGLGHEAPFSWRRPTLPKWGLAAPITDGSGCGKPRNRHLFLGAVAGVILDVFGIVAAVNRAAEMMARARNNTGPDLAGQAERAKNDEEQFSGRVPFRLTFSASAP